MELSDRIRLCITASYKSRCEYRLLLRHDNADQRLLRYGYENKLISEERYRSFLKKLGDIREMKEFLKTTRIEKDSGINYYLSELGFSNEEGSHNAYELLRRPGVKLSRLLDYIGTDYDRNIADQVEIEIKYEGYIEKAKREAAKLRAMDEIHLGTEFNYDEVDHLSIEGRQKLMKYRPLTMGQASRISGVNPADIAVLAIAIKQGKGRKSV
jgi:tRNA uridine 5-carboxymethylaminomethyl modification enzyme